MSVQEKKYNATLVRGETYSIGQYQFFKGRPLEIDAETKRKLNISAVDRYTMQGSEGKEVSVLQKFKFEEVGAAKATGKTAKPMSKAAELAAMQGDGGVEFDEDAGKQAKDSDDEYSVDGEGDDAPEVAAKSKVTAKGGKRVR